MKLLKSLILISILGATSAFAGFASIDGHQVYFGQSGHWAVMYPDPYDGYDVYQNVWRDEGQPWNFSFDEDDGE